MKLILQKSLWMEHSEVGGNATAVLEVMVASVHLPVSSVKKKVFTELEEKLQRAGHLQIMARNPASPPPANHKGKIIHQASQGMGKNEKGRCKWMRTSFSSLEEGFLNQKDSEQNRCGNLSK